MKSRSGFVSNSSTSSFILIGKKIDYVTAEKVIESGGEVVSCSSCDRLPDTSNDVFKATAKHLKIMSELEENGYASFSLYNSIFFEVGYDIDKSIKASELVSKINLMYLDDGYIQFMAGICDNSSSYGANDLYVNYGEDDDEDGGY